MRLAYIVIFWLTAVFLFVSGLRRIKKINTYKVIAGDKKKSKKINFKIKSKGIYSIWNCTNNRFNDVKISYFSLYKQNGRKIALHPSIYPYIRSAKLHVDSKFEIGTFKAETGNYILEYISNKKYEGNYIYITTGRSLSYKLFSLFIFLSGFIMLFISTFVLFVYTLNALDI